MWSISKLSNKALLVINETQEHRVTKYLKNIIHLINNNEWDRARTLRILGVLKMKPINWTFSLFGFQNEFFLSQFLPLQELIFHCSLCKKVVDSLSDYFLTKSNTNEVCIYNKLEDYCPCCKQIVKGQFKRNPFCIFFQFLLNLIC